MFLLIPGFLSANAQVTGPVLKAEEFHSYFDEFAAEEKEMLGTVPAVQWTWFAANIPWLDIPDKEMEKTYYFRWYAFQKHLVKTKDGYLISEFMDDVPWSGKFNMVDAAAGHHIREARWLRDPEYVEDYTRFWFGPDGEPRRYSFWAADSVYQVFLSTGNRDFATSLLPSMVSNYEAWEATHRDVNHIYWQSDDRDGMEDSISGGGYRPTINSYMAGDAAAISRIASLAGKEEIASRFRDKEEEQRSFIETRLWNPKDHFYETVARPGQGKSSNVRELIGYLPWYFDLAGHGHDEAWRQLSDPHGFAGKYGPTTAERRNSKFNQPMYHECLWNGPSWPFATTQTLVALANLLNSPEQRIMNEKDYFQLLQAYSSSQRIRLSGGKEVPWIDEDLNADTGE